MSVRQRQEVQEVPRKAARVRLDPAVPPVERAQPAPGALAGIALRSDPNPGLLRATLHALYDAMWIVTTLLGLPWLLWKSSRHVGFGRMVLERLGRGLGDVKFSGESARVVVHGVSVGEVKVAVPLVRELARRHPDHEVVVSATTNSGLDVAKQVLEGVDVVRFPADISPLVRFFLRRVRPVCVILI